MGACKCRWCQANITTKVAIMEVTNGKRMFFCNEEHRDKFLKKLKAEQEQKEKAEADRSKAYHLVCEIIGRKEIINGILWKEWKIWNKVADNEKIGRYLEENKDYLRDVISRLEDIEFNRIRYLSAILKNRLGDYKPKVKEVEKVVVKCNSSFELFEPTIIRNNEADNVILEDVEDDLL